MCTYPPSWKVRFLKLWNQKLILSNSIQISADLCTHSYKHLKERQFSLKFPLKLFKEVWIIRDMSNFKLYVKPKIYCLVLALGILEPTAKNSECNNKITGNKPYRQMRGASCGMWCDAASRAVAWMWGALRKMNLVGLELLSKGNI